MKRLLFRNLAELFELVIAGLATIVLSIGGAYLEYFAFVTAQGGDTALGLWTVIPGVVCLGFAYLLVTDRIVPTISTLQ